MTAILLLLHALVAIALMGAISHQCLASWRPPLEQPQIAFLNRFSAVTPRVYATPIVALYVANVCLGCVLYAGYRIDIRPELELQNRMLLLAAFEAKEHLAVYGLGLLPGYWVVWNRHEIARERETRRLVTTLLALFVWWSFLVGLLVNNVAGLSA